RIIVIVGPTCSGKTSLSVQLAEMLNTEIISADSRQFYKFLNIGTAKPSKEILNKVKHHFINSLNPDEEYNVSRYEEDASKIIRALIIKNKIPIVVGGSGLYIKALIDGVVETADKDDEYREKLLLIKKEDGIEKLYAMLEDVDEVSAKKMLPQNWKRVMRALEVFHITGKPIWEHYKNQNKKREFNFIQYGLKWEREILYKNIDTRVDKMIEQGLIDEVKNILEIGYSPELNALNTVGYKEIISHLKKEITLDRAIELIKRNTRRYAKRQITWFNKDKRINWIDIKSNSDISRAAGLIIREQNLQA
ncbi:MAG: tRNA (adenosine(37)-N6)-dimethylallyltransferase MiaA, partial [Nitrososphaeraceae archaeon]|nr:tRNA (adenosine(37)-N6)-dimethylallyltransferase MiaA [Nitrososphaeraceae archaeon]